ncbi:hypothetical protein BKA66DRAFT_439632 [Pyrenochaeta sp. MPI-SDFR-AT-0127]|nr:hypothetical protein BKA66DRAFT_439632 [Pyrenochaeta sp. MPI-SDFR-AT-0127]
MRQAAQAAVPLQALAARGLSTQQPSAGLAPAGAPSLGSTSGQARMRLAPKRGARRLFSRHAVKEWRGRAAASSSVTRTCAGRRRAAAGSAAGQPSLMRHRRRQQWSWIDEGEQKKRRDKAGSGNRCICAGGAASNQRPGRRRQFNGCPAQSG